MVISGSYMHEFSGSKDMKKKNDRRRKEVAVGKVAACLCLALISVEQDRVVSTLNIIKH